MSLILDRSRYFRTGALVDVSLPGRGMTASAAREAARDWVLATRTHWPGLLAAHLIGGVTAMADGDAFPLDKDVDLHLIFNEKSPVLRERESWPRIVEEFFHGLPIEAGIKSVADYRSAEVVLANPEIAYHLTVDSILHDPAGLLHGLQDAVRRDYTRRRWVLARLEHERRGLAGALEMLPAVRAQWGGSGEVNILGYITTFVTAALWVATLGPPKGGGKLMLRLREVLAAYERLDLHEELLDIIGLSRIGPAAVERFLQEATAAFDLAVAIREVSPEVAQDFSPFEHKLHGHLRAYFVESCRSLLAAGFHREAMGWVMPYHLATADILLAYGLEAEKPEVAARQCALLQALGLETDAARSTAFARMTGLYERMFALAEEIVANHPEIGD